MSRNATFISITKPLTDTSNRQTLVFTCTS
uniref:Uncharacterized protein n=1 Tax=Anguilla anguilla TaxID=7936 RepID=A0A0E9T1D1_ANGAN